MAIAERAVLSSLALLAWRSPAATPTETVTRINCPSAAIGVCATSSSSRNNSALILEAEPLGVLASAAPLAVHAHISEKDLQPPGAADHAQIAAALGDSGYVGSLSVEMKQCSNWRNAIPAAVAFVRDAYA